MGLFRKPKKADPTKEVARLRKENSKLRVAMVQPWVHQQVIESRDLYESQVAQLRGEVSYLRKAIGFALERLGGPGITSMPAINLVRAILPAVTRLEIALKNAAKAPPERFVIPDDKHRGRMGGHPE